MDILSVSNDNYILNALNLFKSYEINSFNNKKILYYFNVKEEKLKFLQKHVKNLILYEIPKINNYIFNTKIFLFKCYALSEQINRGSGFIYSDSANCFVKKDNFLNIYLNNNDRLLLKYPEQIKKNKFFTTKKCFKLLDCDDTQFKEDHQYWAGFQVYKFTEKNKHLLNKQYEYMLNKDIAFPESNVERPDGSSNDCWFHRNDQSVLSLLVKKYNIEQSFSFDLFNKYGDFYTVFNHDLNFKTNFVYDNILMHARDSKINNYKFVTKEMSEEYARL